MEEEFVETPEVVEEPVAEEPEVQEVEPAEELEGEEVAETPAAPEERKVPLKALEEERRKRQEFEARVKALEEKQTAPPPKQPTTIEEHFDANPQGVLSWIDQQITAKEAELDDAAVRQLERTKINLLQRQVFMSTQRQEVQRRSEQVRREMLKVAPELETNEAALKATAKEMGYNDTDLENIFNPEVVGDFAVRALTAVKKFHDMKNAGKTLKTKEVKQPTKVESAGNGIPTKTAPDDASLKAQVARGEMSWGEYLTKAGRIPT